MPPARAHEPRIAVPPGTVAEMWVPGPLPGLNELIAFSAKRRGGWSPYAQAKKQWGALIARLAARLPRFSRVHISFLWRERNKRRDPDNFASAGRKLILDGLVNGGALEGDGWGQIAGWSDAWEVAQGEMGAGCKLTITEVP